MNVKKTLSSLTSCFQYCSWLNSIDESKIADFEKKNTDVIKVEREAHVIVIYLWYLYLEGKVYLCQFEDIVDISSRFYLRINPNFQRYIKQTVNSFKNIHFVQSQVHSFKYQLYTPGSNLLDQDAYWRYVKH